MRLGTGDDAVKTGRFDAWTRRRFGLGVSGLTAGLVSMVSGDAAAKKRKRKCKKCKKPDTCPHRFCCQCASDSGCTLVDAPNISQASGLCHNFCDSIGTQVVLVDAPTGTSTFFCGRLAYPGNPPNKCLQVNCPLVL
jgi:hypothetical protein